MGFRFQKCIRIVKGLTLNHSMSGTTWIVGGKGVSINVRGDKITGNVGISGREISYQERLDQPSTEDGNDRAGHGIGNVVWILIILAMVVFIFSR